MRTPREIAAAFLDTVHFPGGGSYSLPMLDELALFIQHYGDQRAAHMRAACRHIARNMMGSRPEECPNGPDCPGCLAFGNGVDLAAHFISKMIRRLPVTTTPEENDS
jgi:hypothetical protein